MRAKRTRKDEDSIDAMESTLLMLAHATRFAHNFEIVDEAAIASVKSKLESKSFDFSTTWTKTKSAALALEMMQMAQKETSDARLPKHRPVKLANAKATLKGTAGAAVTKSLYGLQTGGNLFKKVRVLLDPCSGRATWR